MRQVYLFAFLFCVVQVFAQPYSVGHATYNFVDASRTGGTSISGAISFPSGASGREIGTQVYYPATSTGNNTPLASGKFPVIVFGHGFAMTYDAYTTLFDSMARNGFIVALPTTEGSLIPSPVHLDFGKDLAFVAGQFLTMNVTSGNFFFNSLTGREAIGGHSMGGGCTFLADAYANDSVICYFTYAAAETTPSAITAAASITRPHLLFSGTDDCIAPTATNQTPMYNALQSACKTHIDITNASHCEFADYNATCSLGEVTCEAAGNLTSVVEQDRVRMYLEPYLDYYLKGICPAWTKFENLIDTATISADTQACNNIVPQNAQIMGNHTFCYGTSAQLNATPTGFHYTWSNQDTGVSISSNVVGTYTVTVSNSICNLASGPFQLTELYPPTLPTAINGPDSVCSGITNLVFSIGPDSIATFNWVLPGTWIITQGAGTNSITATSGNSSGTIYVSAENSCDTTAQVSKNIIVVPSNLGNVAGIIGHSVVCQGSQVSYSVLPVNGASNYSWSYPSGWSALSVTDSIAVVFSASNNPGYVIAAAVNACGQSLPDTLAVTINNPPNVIGISGLDSFCSIDVVPITYMAEFNGTADSFQWFYSSYWDTASGVHDSIIALDVDTNGLISVVAYNSCGVSDTLSKNIAFGLSPSLFIYQSGDTLRAAALSGGAIIAYQWYLDNVPIPGATAQTYIGTESGTYGVVVATVPGCFTSSNPYQFTLSSVVEVGISIFEIYPNPAHTIVNISVGCTGAVLQIEDMEGQIVQEQILNDLHSAVSLNKLSAGVYIINLAGSNTNYRQKLVVY